MIYKGFSDDNTSSNQHAADHLPPGCLADHPHPRGGGEVHSTRAKDGAKCLRQVSMTPLKPHPTL